MDDEDGQIDYSRYTLVQLRDIERNINAALYPKNYENLQRAIARCAELEPTVVESTESISRSKYASFWQRLGAYLLDILIWLPLIFFSIWGGEQSRQFSVYYFLPGVVFSLWYYVYLVRRFGGTPGKLIMGIKIVRVDENPVGYREALLRYSVLFVLSTVGQVAHLQGVLEMQDAEYYSLAWQEKALRIQEVAPAWLSTVSLLTNLWVWSEFIVMLTNKRRRAIHDFMAGTVVIRDEN